MSAKRNQHHPARPKFRKLIAANDYETALDIRAQTRSRTAAQIIDINMDEGLIDSEAAMGALSSI